MKVCAALFKEQNVPVAVVMVDDYVVGNHFRSRDALLAASRVFPGTVPVLFGKTQSGRSEFFGRKDVVEFLSRVPTEALPWAEYSVN